MTQSKNSCLKHYNIEIKGKNSLSEKKNYKQESV